MQSNSPIVTDTACRSRVVHDANGSAVDASLNVSRARLLFRLGLGQSSASGPCLLDNMLEAFLEPVEPKEDNRGVNRDGRRDLAEEVKHNLLKGIEKIDIDSIEACLRIGATGEDEGINVGQLAASRAINHHRCKYTHANNPEIYDSWVSIMVSQMEGYLDGHDPYNAR